MLTLSRLLALWFPIAMMYMFMSFEAPVVQAVAAHASEPELNLAAYGYAFFCMLIFVSPCAMILSASNALVKGPKSYFQFQKYAYSLSALSTITCFTIGISGIFFWFSNEVVGIDKEIARLAEPCFLIFSLYPLIDGFRRFHQGILIHVHQGRWLGWGGAIRILTAGTTAILLFWFSQFPGSIIVSLSLSLAITTEALFVRWRSEQVIQKFFRSPPDDDQSHSLYEINAFYLPLALTAVALIAVQPTIIFFLAKTTNAQLNLAAWPIVMSFLFLFLRPSLAFQEIFIAHHEDNKKTRQLLLRFAIWIFVGMSIIASLFLLSPLYTIWFEDIIGLSHPFASLMYSSVALCIPQVALGLIAAWLRATHTLAHSTQHLFFGSAIELLCTICFMAILLSVGPFTGVFSGVLSFLMARAVSCLYMWTVSRP